MLKNKKYISIIFLFLSFFSIQIFARKIAYLTPVVAKNILKTNSYELTLKPGKITVELLDQGPAKHIVKNLDVYFDTLRKLSKDKNFPNTKGLIQDYGLISYNGKAIVDKKKEFQSYMDDIQNDKECKKDKKFCNYPSIWFFNNEVKSVVGNIISIEDSITMMYERAAHPTGWKSWFAKDIRNQKDVSLTDLIAENDLLSGLKKALLQNNYIKDNLSTKIQKVTTTTELNTLLFENSNSCSFPWHNNYNRFFIEDYNSKTKQAKFIIGMSTSANVCRGRIIPLRFIAKIKKNYHDSFNKTKNNQFGFFGKLSVTDNEEVEN